MTVLTTDDLTPRHAYLASARPDWRASMASIRAQGGPWPCPRAGCGPSMLCYRCSVCGRDLAGSGTTQGREG
jgi:hypothetical protein